MVDAKYTMTVEQNIFLAKRNIVDYIWKSARLEGLPITYPETDAVINWGNAGGLAVNDVITVNNLKHAWQFVLENTEYPTDYPFICEINRKIGANLIQDAGFIRNIPVKIGGTDWIPDLPIEADIKDEIKNICAIVNPMERAITLMCYGMRRQIFLDGNKRTAMLAANHIMIRNGLGILSVPINSQLEFYSHLIKYYETGNMETLKMFVYDNCVDGMEVAHVLPANERLGVAQAFSGRIAQDGKLDKITTPQNGITSRYKNYIALDSGIMDRNGSKLDTLVGFTIVGERAELFSRKYRKGDTVHLTGTLYPNSYAKDGANQTTLEIRVTGLLTDRQAHSIEAFIAGSIENGTTQTRDEPLVPESEK